MGRFAGLSGIKTNQGGVYFLPGDYVVDVDEVKFITSRKGQDCFIVGATVVASTNPDRPVGTVCSQVILLRADIFDTVMGNVKQFAASVLGVDANTYEPDANPGESPEEASDRFWEEALEAMVSDDQPAKGVRLGLNVANIKTKQNKDFSKHFWSPQYTEKVAA